MNIKEKSIKLHRELKGKIEVVNSASINNMEDLSLVYTPGVAEVCKEIQRDISLSYELTRRWNLVAVVTDGSAVLGLGDIGPEAAMPVMEGKCALFKTFGNVDAFPLCINSKNIDDIVNTVKLVSGSFGGINLEDISSPRCFEIERRLKEECDIPIFHDDQHGTAIVTIAALLNAMKIVNKNINNIKVVVNGAGAAGIAITNLLISLGIKNVILCDSKGAIFKGRENLNKEKALIAEASNRHCKKGSLNDVLIGADVFIGVSVAGVLTKVMVSNMANNPIVFAMANPIPEIMPNDAKSAGAKIVGTGRSDFPNQINNVLAFPGIFRGALNVRAKDINNEMKIAAAKALASLVSEDELKEDYIIPSVFDTRVAKTISAEVARVARMTGVARV